MAEQDSEQNKDEIVRVLREILEEIKDLPLKIIQALNES